jgi:hypothetical protein
MTGKYAAHLIRLTVSRRKEIFMQFLWQPPQSIRSFYPPRLILTAGKALFWEKTQWITYILD